MPRLTRNEEFCAVARSLDVLGERWALLIVRDLITGPKRFGELQELVVGITPKWLSARLRSLEDAGIVEHHSPEYRLSPKGEDLLPLLEELALWSTKHDLRAPLPGEVLVPEHELWGLIVFLNRMQVRLSRPVSWLLVLDDEHAHTINFDGERWSWEPGEHEADLLIRTNSDAFGGLLAAANARGESLSGAFRFEGRAAQVREFKRLFGLGRQP